MKSVLKLFNRYSKYRAKPTIIDGIKFASKAEAALYFVLKHSHTGPIICQPKVYLTRAKILFKPDFKVGNSYYEMKGVELRSWRLKRRLWYHYGAGTLYIYKMKGVKPYCHEVITPILDAPSYE